MFKVQDQTQDLLDRYNDIPDIAPTAKEIAQNHPDEYAPKYPFPQGGDHEICTD
jgi:hypothetical protein